MSDFVDNVKLMNEIGGTSEQFDERKLSLYVGLCLEEMAEMLEAFLNKRIATDNRSLTKIANIHDHVKELSGSFKQGKYDSLAPGADLVEIADAGADLAVVGLGTVISAGFDVKGVTSEVTSSNLSKFPLSPDGTRSVLLDDNGKWKKGPDFFEPNLKQYQRA